MFKEPVSRARWLSVCSALFLVSCGSGQTNPKPAGASETNVVTESTTKTDSNATSPPNSTANVDKNVEVAGSIPSKTGSGATDVAGEKPYQLTLFEIERPPFAYTLKTPVKVTAGPAPTLTKVSETKNKITDDVDWFEKNKLSLPGRAPSKDGAKLPKAPERGVDTWGNDKLHYVLDHGNHYVLLYGANFAATKTVSFFDKGQVTRGIYDFSTFVKPPEVVKGEEEFTSMEVLWAQKVDDVLYVSSAHHTYAKSSKGKNAFLTAVDTEGALRWQSDPLVCNSTNFVVHGAYIICGYGFSKEDDFLYVISRADGKTVSKTPIKAGASYLVLKGNQLFVRGYDYDFVFDVK